MREMGVRSPPIFCNRCGHFGTVNCDRWPDDMPAPDIVLCLKCSGCGSKDLGSHINVSELYAKTNIARL